MTIKWSSKEQIINKDKDDSIMKIKRRGYCPLFVDLFVDRYYTINIYNWFQRRVNKLLSFEWWTQKQLFGY